MEVDKLTKLITPRTNQKSGVSVSGIPWDFALRDYVFLVSCFVCRVLVSGSRIPGTGRKVITASPSSASEHLLYFLFRVSGETVKNVGFCVSSFVFCVSFFGCRVSGFGSRNSGHGCREPCVKHRVQGVECRVWSFGCRVSGIQCRV